MPRKCRIIQILGTKPFRSSRGDDMTEWSVQVQWDNSNGPVENATINSKTHQFQAGETFEADRSQNQYGVKLTKVQQQGARGGGGGGGGGYGGGGNRRPAPEPMSYAEAKAVYMQIAQDFGIQQMPHEFVTSMFIAIQRGDVLRPGVMPGGPAQTPQQPQQPTQGAPAPASPPASEW